MACFYLDKDVSWPEYPSRTGTPNCIVPVWMYVEKIFTTPLLGHLAIAELSILSMSGSVIQAVSSDWKTQYPTLFQGIGLWKRACCTSETGRSAIFSSNPSSGADPHETESGCCCSRKSGVRWNDTASGQCSHTARRVAHPLLPKVKAELARMVKLDIIAPVTDPTDWCAPVVPVTKKDGSVRICVDLKRLNASVERAHFLLPTVYDTLGKLSGATVFSTLDTASGFRQIPLSPACAKLTTFITPYGRYHFK